MEESSGDRWAADLCVRGWPRRHGDTDGGAGSERRRQVLKVSRQGTEEEVEEGEDRIRGREGVIHLRQRGRTVKQWSGFVMPPLSDEQKARAESCASTCSNENFFFVCGLMSRLRVHLSILFSLLQSRCPLYSSRDQISAPLVFSLPCFLVPYPYAAFFFFFLFCVYSFVFQPVTTGRSNSGIVFA